MLRVIHSHCANCGYGRSHRPLHTTQTAASRADRRPPHEFLNDRTHLLFDWFGLHNLRFLVDTREAVSMWAHFEPAQPSSKFFQINLPIAILIQIFKHLDDC